MRFLGLVALAAACSGNSATGDGGGGAPMIGPSAATIIAPAAGDDILFATPDIEDALDGGVTIVYVTAPRDGTDREAREMGVKTAYAQLLGSDAWSCGTGALDTDAHQAEICANGHLTLVYLNYPAGGDDGSDPESLLNLWQGTTPNATVATVDGSGTSYDQPGLVDVVTHLISITSPLQVTTFEIAATHGDDRSDHMLTGALAWLAATALPSLPDLQALRGDNIQTEAPNTDGADAMTAIEACGAPCTSDPAAAYAATRHYPDGMHRGSGKLSDGTMCITVSDGGTVGLGDCASAPSFDFGDDGTIIASSAQLCLDVLFTGELVSTAAPCQTTGGFHFGRDDEGHLWSGITPPIAADMSYQHVTCVAELGGKPHATLCGRDLAPLWQLTQ
ncbi:MAG TPA: hypothetical protein VGM88_19960 [Kofleriaceae bacterium]|jgi:hypothetical protein